jgi:hypothetical protein
MKRNGRPGCAGDEPRPISQQLQAGVKLDPRIQDVIGKPGMPRVLTCDRHWSCDAVSHEIPIASVASAF